MQRFPDMVLLWHGAGQPFPGSLELTHEGFSLLIDLSRSTDLGPTTFGPPSNPVDAVLWGTGSVKPWTHLGLLDPAVPLWVEEHQFKHFRSYGGKGLGHRFHTFAHHRDFSVGPFTLRAIPVTEPMPDPPMLALSTGDGVPYVILPPGNRLRMGKHEIKQVRDFSPKRPRVILFPSGEAGSRGLDDDPPLPEALARCKTLAIILVARIGAAAERGVLAATAPLGRTLVCDVGTAVNILDSRGDEPIPRNRLAILENPPRGSTRRDQDTDRVNDGQLEAYDLKVLRLTKNVRRVSLDEVLRHPKDYATLLHPRGNDRVLASLNAKTEVFMPRNMEELTMAAGTYHVVDQILGHPLCETTFIRGYRKYPVIDMVEKIAPLRPLSIHCLGFIPHHWSRRVTLGSVKPGVRVDVEGAAKPRKQSRK